MFFRGSNGPNVPAYTRRTFAQPFDPKGHAEADRAPSTPAHFAMRRKKISKVRVLQQPVSYQNR